MATRFKVGDAIPFPTTPGIWLRFVTQGNEVLQGHVLLFQDEGVVDMSNKNVTTIDVLQEGDRRASADGMLATYSPVTGVSITKSAKVNGDGKSVDFKSATEQAEPKEGDLAGP